METTEQTNQEIIEDKDSVKLDLDPKATIDYWLQDESVNKNLDQAGLNFYNATKGNWSSIEQIVKKSQLKDIKQVKMLLDLLVMSKRAFSKIDEKDKKLKFKITLNKDTRKTVLESQILIYEKALAELKLELLSL